MRDLGFDAVVSLSLTDPGMPARLRIPDGDLRARADSRSPIRSPPSTRWSARRCSAPCSTPPRYNLAHGAERVALFESGRAYLREGSSPAMASWPASSSAERPRRPSSPGGSGRWRAGRCAAAAGAATGAGRLLLAQGHARGARRRSSAAAVEVVPGEEPFLHPGRAAAVLRRRRGRRLDRRDPSARLPRLGPRRRRRIRGRPGAAGRRLAGRRRAATRT